MHQDIDLLFICIGKVENGNPWISFNLRVFKVNNTIAVLGISKK